MYRWETSAALQHLCMVFTLHHAVSPFLPAQSPLSNTQGFLKIRQEIQSWDLISIVLTNGSCRANTKCQVITISAFFLTEKALSIFS